MKRLGLCASHAGLCQLEPLLRLGELEAVAVPSSLIDAQRPELLHDPAGPKALLLKHWSELDLLVGALAAGALVRMILRSAMNTFF